MSAKFKAQLYKTLKDLQFDLTLEPRPDDKKKRHLELHPSSFPYCPLQTLVEVAQNGLYLSKWESASSDYYCSVGTAVHTVMQKHFGRAMHVVGDWTCKKCGNVAAFKTFEQAGQCCGRNRHYEELGIKFKKTVRGHTDGLFLYEGEYWVGDYKTASVVKCDKYKEEVVDGKEPSLPLRGNREQIRSYVVLLEREYKIKIRGWALLYLARDNPFKHNVVCIEEFDDDLRAEYRKLMSLYDKQYDAMLDVDNSHTGLDFLIETKPCKCDADYQELFASDFKECPLYSVCFDEHKLIKKLGPLVRRSPHLPIRHLDLLPGVPPKPEKKQWVGSGNYLPPKITEF